MTSSQLSDQSMYSRGQVLTRDFNTLRSLIVQIIMNTRLLLGGTAGAFSACIPAAGQHSHASLPAGDDRRGATTTRRLNPISTALWHCWRFRKTVVLY